ncbi:MAG: ParB N-terminal domain-containing protein [Treponema sp.]|nr:ParB N-terminal domain-containing protein [Treponema sp.]
MKQNAIFNLLDKNKEGKIIKIKLEEITMLPELQNAFHMDAEVKDRIKADIAQNGFSKAHPIHIFRWEDKWVLCDGHTRYTAARELGLEKIYAQVHEFESINQALLFSMKEQFNRRNIEDSELFKQFEILRQEEIDGRKLTATEMSERLKKSKRHIFKLQEVFSKSSKEQLKAIREGEASINQVYNEIKKQEQIEAQNKSEVEKTESLSEVAKPTSQATSSDKTSEQVSAQQIEQTVQSEMQKNLQRKHRELQNKEIELKQKEAKLSKRLSDKQILLLGAKYALIQTAKGKFATEILESPFFKDSVKASDISFVPEDLELLKTI